MEKDKFKRSIFFQNIFMVLKKICLNLKQFKVENGLNLISKDCSKCF